MCSIDDSNRPVKLHKVVLGYPESTSSFKFDMSLNYRLAGVIQSFSENKPTLVVSVIVKVSVPHVPLPSSVPLVKQLSKQQQHWLKMLDL